MIVSVFAPLYDAQYKIHPSFFPSSFERAIKIHLLKFKVIYNSKKQAVS